MVTGAARLRGRASEALQSPFAPFILLGVLLRIVVLPFTAHLDAMLMFWQATDTVGSGHLNPYDYAYQQYGPKIFNPLIWSPYGWAFYGTAGLWASLLRLSGLHPLAPWTWAWDVALLPRAITLFKLLYALVEAVTVFLLCRVTEDSKPRPIIAVLWLLSPVTLYTSYMMAQNDLLPVACVVVSLWAANHALRQGRESGWWAYLAAAALGFGGAYKLFPLACLPVVVLLLRRTMRDRLALFVVGSVPFLLCTLPFVGSRAYRYSSLLNPEATGVLSIPLPWPGGIVVPIIVVAYSCLLFYLYDYCPNGSLRVLCVSYFVALLALLIFQPALLPQWCMWVLPCLVLFCAAQPSLWKYVIVQSVFFALWTSSFVDVSDLGLGLLSSATSTWFGAVPPLSLLIDPIYSFDHLLSAAYGLYLCAWLFIGIALWGRRSTPLFGSRFVRAPHGIALLLPLLVIFAVLWANLVWGQRRVVVARSEQGGSTTKSLTPTQTVSQSFVVPSTILAPALSCIELQLHTEHRFNMTPVQLTLAEATGQVVATAEATPSGAPVDTWQPFCFAPVKVQPGRSYLFTVRSPDPEGAITVVRGKKNQDSYPEGRSIMNGQAASDGRDLTFRADIMLPWANVWRDVAHRYAEDPVLFVLHGFACIALVVALCIAIVLQLVVPRVPRRASARIGAPIVSEDN